MAGLEYWLWLSSVGLSPRAKKALLERFGGPEEVFRAPEGSFAELPGVGKAEAAVLERRDLSLTEEIREACERQGIWIVTMQDAAYPQRLRHIFSPPVVLYGKGSLPAQETDVPIAVIGTREHSPYGLRMAQSFGAELARCGATVVSLLTSEIEQTAAREAMRSGGKVIGVLGIPHERERRPLAAEVAECGTLLSEYPPYTRPLREFFRDRNRVASGLSVGVLVVEAPERSGTSLFVAEAAEQGKEIFAVPGNADADKSAGTLRMIREGAHLVTSGWELLSEFQPLYRETLRYRPEEEKKEPETPAQPAEKAQTAETSVKKDVDKPAESAYIDLSKQLENLTEEQLRIVTAIDRDSKHIDDIIRETGLPVHTVLPQLTLLQIKGYLRREPGQRYSLNITKK